MAAFEPDEPIHKIRVQLHTCAVSDASTDSDIFIELFDWPSGAPLPFPFLVELDTSGYNDFEGGNTNWYTLPKWCFQGRIINDIRRVNLYKGDDWGTDWGFGWISVWVNGKELYTSPSFNDPDEPTWLEDGETWHANYKPIEFTAPVINNLGLHDASANVHYSKKLHATGGRKPLSWKITASSGDAFADGPTIAATNADGTEALFRGKTVNTSTTASWKGRVRVTDAEGRQSENDLEMRVIFALPPPSIASFSPSFGWPGVVPSEPIPVIVTIESGGDNFDSRTNNATRVFFSSASGFVEAELVAGEITSSKVRVTVPSGAVAGPLRVQTAFGAVTSTASFFAHPCGYRFISGFSFVNRCDDDDDTDGFPNTFDWLRFEQTFGLDEMWIMAFDQALFPNPISTFFYITTHDFIGNGCCHGFALASLQMKMAFLPNSTLPTDNSSYPVDDALWDLNGAARPSWALSNLIQCRQLVTVSDEGLSYFLDRIDSIPNVGGEICQMDARPALNQIEASILSGLSNPSMLALAQNCSPFAGHVVVPYAIEKGPARTVIRVWDMNRPAVSTTTNDEGSFISVDESNGKWIFKSSGGEEWDGLYFFNIPLSSYGHQLDWSIPGFGSLMDVVGTFMLGCAGTDSSGRIIQVSDDSGKCLFDAHGVPLGRAEPRPASARVAPIMGHGGPNRPLVMVTGKDTLLFTVRSNQLHGAVVSQKPATFAIVQGADAAISLEEFSEIHMVRFEPVTGAVEVAPRTGRSSPIVRVSRRFPETRESLTYAFRLVDIDSATPVRVEPYGAGRSVVLRAGTTDLSFDVEVTHTDRIGQRRILEHSGLRAVANSVTTLSLPQPNDIDRRGSTPLVRTIDSNGAGLNPSQDALGHQPSGPIVVAPHRIVARPALNVGGDPLTVERAIKVDLTGSRTPSSDGTLRFRLRDGVEGTQQGNQLTVSLRPGMHPLRIVAEDGESRRSFPRTVYVSVAEPGQRIVPIHTLFGEDVTVQPGQTGAVALGINIIREPVSRVSAQLSIRERHSGSGIERARFTGEVSLAGDLQTVGAQVQATLGAGGLALRLEISWDPTKARSGRIDLGHLVVAVPAGVTLGSGFLVKGTATAVREANAGEAPKALNVLPTLVKVWGGPEPTSVDLECAPTVAENASVEAETVLADVPAQSGNVGWWVESAGGVVGLQQDTGNPRRAIITGKRAGRVTLCAVVGTQVARKQLKVTPSVGTDMIRLARDFRHLRRIRLRGAED